MMKKVYEVEGRYIRVRDNDYNEAGFAILDNETKGVYLDNDFHNYDRGTELIVDQDGNIDAEATKKLAQENIAEKEKVEKEYKQKMLKKLDIIKPYIGKEIYSKKSGMKGIVTDKYHISGSVELPGSISIYVKYENGREVAWALQDLKSHLGENK